MSSLDRTTLESELRGCTLARRFVLFESTGSTNDEARRLGREGAAHGTVVVADEQTRGRGRRQRHWDSPRGVGLYVSLILRPPPERVAGYAAAMQFAAGISIAETLAPMLSQPVELVWPNDVFAAGLKLAGVLVEAETTGDRIEFLVCGMGLNLNQTRDDFAPELRRLAGSVRQLGGDPVERHTVLGRLLFTLESWEAVARDGDPRAVADRFVELAPSAVGSRTEMRVGGRLVEGTSRGVTADGALLLETDEGVRPILVGELERAWRKR